MFGTILFAFYVASTIAALIVVAVAPFFLKSPKDLEEAGVDLHGQGR